MKTVLITGGSGGIGLDLARIFARENYSLVLVARDEAGLARAKAELERSLLSVVCIAKDLSLAGAAEELVGELETRNISIDILVNNAGFGDNGLFAESDLQKQEAMIGLNVTALTVLTRLLLPGMLKRSCGKILNIASTASFVPGPYMSVYYATKAYVVSFSESLAEELLGTGITVTALCPGATKTRFAEAAGATGTTLFKNPNLLTSEEVARAGYQALVNGKRVVVVGFLNKIGIMLSRFIPRRILAKMVKRIQRPLPRA